ncbi:hypothetical protein FRC00_012300 [Tulasnella sp. 408]|nr:hypothetical protein FRC00_012300 [Tulasnella sp. 408]
MNTTAYAFEQPITERPEIPARFGEDGGKFYSYYDQLADELDEDLTKRLKSQLDGLLIFAGLFAGVNSAFLALTLPMMSADPADDTNALLLQLVKGGNVTINSEADLPSATFAPPPAIYPVNILFAVSLTCALMSSFLAVLGQQWLVYYRKRSGGGAAHQRKEQLRRQMGAQRWRLELVLDDILPGLLQVGLVIFCISFILYLRTLSTSMSTSISAIVGAGLAITVGAAVCATWDRMCPYQSPLSHLLCWTIDRMKLVMVAFLWLVIFLKAYLHEILPKQRSRTEPQMAARRGEEAQGNSWRLAQEITSRTLTLVGRKEETANDLIVGTVKRVILTSEHTAALIHAATNICAIDDKESLRQLLSDADFFDRLHDLYSTFSKSSRSLPTQLRTVPEAATKAFASAILHLALSVGTIMDLAPPKDRALAIKNSLQVQPVLSHDQVMYFRPLARWAGLERNLWDGDLKDVNHLLLLGIVLQELFLSTIHPYGRVYLLRAIRSLANFTISRQLLRALCCAAKLYISCRQTERYAQLPQLFEVVKTTYGSPDTDEFCTPLAETLRYIREVAAPHEPGHPENMITSDLFRLVLVALDTPTYRDREERGELEEEHGRFEAWIN